MLLIMGSCRTTSSGRHDTAYACLEQGDQPLRCIDGAGRGVDDTIEKEVEKDFRFALT
jgi:hypothetical protein